MYHGSPNGSASRNGAIESKRISLRRAGGCILATAATATGSSARSANSVVPVSVSVREASAAWRCARTAAMLALDFAAFERRPRAARFFHVLKIPPGNAAQLVGQVLDAACAGRRIRDLGKI